jgi:hypothetical protein
MYNPDEEKRKLLSSSLTYLFCSLFRKSINLLFLSSVLFLLLFTITRSLLTSRLHSCKRLTCRFLSHTCFLLITSHVSPSHAFNFLLMYSLPSVAVAQYRTLLFCRCLHFRRTDSCSENDVWMTNFGRGRFRTKKNKTLLTSIILTYSVF